MSFKGANFLGVHTSKIDIDWQWKEIDFLSSSTSVYNNGLTLVLLGREV